MYIPLMSLGLFVFFEWTPALKYRHELGMPICKVAV